MADSEEDKKYLNGMFTDIKANLNQEQMANRFSKMMGNVMNMINTNGPIYHTWIKFQFGKKDKAVIFNTDTQNTDQNLIASLEIDKTGANTCNSFTLNVLFDPFNYGQETKNQIEYLDECIAEAQSYNLDEDVDSLRGYIQYGYSNVGSDLELMSPTYQFIMTDFNSKVKASSGVTSWTFEGVCALGADCDYTTEIGPYPSDWKICDVIMWTLFYNYGDNNNKPEGQTGDCNENEYKYRFDISKEILNDSPTVGDYLGEGGQIEKTKDNPIKFVENIMNLYPCLKSELDSGKYNDTSGLKYTQIPRYDWYITETDGIKTFHLTHYSPDDKESKAQVYWLTCPGSESGLTWGTQNKNIVIDWNPQVDTKLYVIRRAKFKRIQRQIESGSNYDFEELAGGDEELKTALSEAFKEDATATEKGILQELYDAEITLVGIPADAPINAHIKIIPRILESVSRTAGVYIVKGSSDHITNGGVYTTTLKLFRKDDVDENWASLQQLIAEQKVENNTTIQNNTNNNSQSGGSSGGGGR